MGVDPFLIPPTLVMIIGQRLTPLLCTEGRKEEEMSESIRRLVERELADLPPTVRGKIVLPDKVYQAEPSATCPSGTKGRTGVFEILTMDRELEKIILKTPSEADIYSQVRQKGFLTMKEDAIIKAFRGLIPFSEVNKL